MQKLLALAAAGALGTLARYGLSGLVQRGLGASFPWGTWVVNVSGCFAVGLFWSFAEHRFPASTQLRTVVVVGFVGAFSTFSAFILETGELVRFSEWLYAGTNLVGQVAVGMVVFFLGSFFGRLL